MLCGQHVCLHLAAHAGFKPAADAYSVAAADEPTRSVWLWDAHTRVVVQRLAPAHPAPVTDIRYCAPVGLLASLCDRQLSLWV